METQTLISIDLIDPNPYQPRKVEDPDVVTEIAASIKQNGLMQVPTARQVNGHYQLAFGHTRLAAFKELGEDCMPLIIRELTDLQMFELGVAENIKRRDLNPLEQAQAMRRYMDEFGKNSVDTGAFFNVSPELIRQKVRLLNLPEHVQEKVRTGVINETAARSILTLDRLDSTMVEEAVNDILDGEKAEDAVSMALRMSSKVKRLDEDFFSTKAKSFKYLPELTIEALGAALELDGDETTDETLTTLLSKMQQKNAKPESEIETKTLHLLKPPACTACPFFAQVDGTSYCAWSDCFSRKRDAQISADLHRASESSGIAIYSEADGKHMELYYHSDSHQKLFTEKNADLRLSMVGHRWRNFDGIPNEFAVVAVGATYEALKKAEKQNEARRERTNPSYNSDEYKRQEAIKEIGQKACGEFVWEHVSPIFAALLNGVTQMDFLKTLAANINSYSYTYPESASLEKLDKLPKNTRANLLRRRLVVSIIYGQLDWSVRHKIFSAKKPVAALIKNHVQGLATTWGVKLGKDFESEVAAADQAIAEQVNQINAKAKK